MRAADHREVTSVPAAHTRTSLAVLLASVALVAARDSAHASVDQTAPVEKSQSSQDATLPDGRTLIERAMSAMGVLDSTALDSEVASFVSISSFETPMGIMRVDYSFLAATPETPVACKVVQSNAALKTTFEIGTADGVAWIGESGRYKAADPRMASELLGGSDLQLLMRSLLTRFGRFTTERMETTEGKRVWVVSMQPKAVQVEKETPRAWTIRLDAQSGLPMSFDAPIAVPAGAKAEAATDATAPTMQRTELGDWKPIELGVHATTKVKEALAAKAPIAFREAVRIVSGLKVTMRYERVAMNTLEAGSIVPPPLAAPTEAVKSSSSR